MEIYNHLVIPISNISFNFQLKTFSWDPINFNKSGKYRTRHIYVHW